MDILNNDDVVPRRVKQNSWVECWKKPKHFFLHFLSSEESDYYSVVLTATRTAGAGTVCKAVGYKPAGSWNTTTTLPLLGTNCTLSTGPPLFLRLSKCSRMSSRVVLYEMPLTTMLAQTGTWSMVTLAEFKPLFSPLVLILLKSKMNKNVRKFLLPSHIKIKLGTKRKTLRSIPLLWYHTSFT